MGTALERVLGALRTVKASGAEERERERLDDAALRAWEGGVRAAKWQAVAGNSAAWRSRWRSSWCSVSVAPGSCPAPSTSAR